jgi:hypothetical protein
MIPIFYFFGNNDGDAAFSAITLAHSLLEISAAGIIAVVPIFITVAFPIFRDGAVKNEVIWGTSRTTLYAVRLLLTAVLCIIIRVVFVASGMIVTTIVAGFGYTPDGFWLSFLQAFSAQTFMFIAVSWLGVFLTFTIKEGSNIVITFFTLIMAPGMVIQFLGFFNVNPSAIYFLLNIDVMTIIAYIPTLCDPYNTIGILGADQLDIGILRALAVGAFWMIVPTVFGIMKFQRAEIK